MCSNRSRPQILCSFLSLSRIKTEIWLYFIIVISTQAPLHPWRRLVVIMHLVPAPAITDLCGEDYKKLFGLLPSPRSPTNDFQKSHQFLWLVSQEGCWNLHEGDTLKRFFADIYFWPNYDCLEEKEATIQILLETSAGTHKPMQNWDKLKKAIASRKERQTSQPNATLIPTHDRPLGQLQSHLAQAWSWARRRCWHRKSSSSKSGLQLGDSLRGTDSDRLVTPRIMNGQPPISKTLQVTLLWGRCDPWAPRRAERAPCACRGKRSNSASVNDTKTHWQCSLWLGGGTSIKRLQSKV